MWFLVILNTSPKILSRSPLIRQKSVLEENKESGPDLTSPTEGGPGGIPPGIHTYHRHLQKPERSSFHSLSSQTSHNLILHPSSMVGMVLLASEFLLSVVIDARTKIIFQKKIERENHVGVKR